MSLTFSGLKQLQANASASETLISWIAGEEAVALLIGAVDSGIIDALRMVNTPQQIAGATGLDKKRIEDILFALEVHGLVKQHGGLFKIAPNLELLTSADAARSLTAILQTAKVRLRNLESISKVGDDYTELCADDVLSCYPTIASFVT